MADPSTFVQAFGVLAIAASLVAVVVAANSLGVIIRWLTTVGRGANGRRIAAWAAWWRAGSLVALGTVIATAATVAVLSSGQVCGTSDVLRASTLAVAGLLTAGGALADTWERWALRRAADHG